MIDDDQLLRNMGGITTSSSSATNTTNHCAAAAAAALPSSSFTFPFTPLGLNLFDLDPSRLLSILHQRTWFTEDNYRYENMRRICKEQQSFYNNNNNISLQLDRNRSNLFTPPLISKDFNHHHHHHHHRIPMIPDNNNGTVMCAAKDDPTTTTTTTTQQMNLNSIADLLVGRCSNNNNFTPHTNESLNKERARGDVNNTFNRMLYHPAAPVIPMFHLHANLQQNSIPPESIVSEVSDTEMQKKKQKQKHSADDNDMEIPSINSTASNATNNTNTNNNNTTTTTSLHDEATAIRDRDSGNSSAATSCSITTSPMPCKSIMEQQQQQQQQGVHVQRRPPSNSSVGDAIMLKSYPSMFLLGGRSSPLEISGCKDTKCNLSSSSTSSISTSNSTSTPPLPPSSSSANNIISKFTGNLLKKSLTDNCTNVYSSDSVVEEETRCIVCNAHFPNVWLLEQHAALQHPLLGGPDDEKPFICEQCGQSYRYRSAYTKHKEQNHRARLPADKLFTCDVCGMQFRYLKSFKKHRLNHALERLHGKKGAIRTSGGGGGSMRSSSPQMAINLFANHFQQHLQSDNQDISSVNINNVNQTFPNKDTTSDSDRGEDLRIKIKKEADHHIDIDDVEDDNGANLNNITKGSLDNEQKKKTSTLNVEEINHLGHFNYKNILQGTSSFGLGATASLAGSLAFKSSETIPLSNKRNHFLNIAMNRNLDIEGSSMDYQKQQQLPSHLQQTHASISSSSQQQQQQQPPTPPAGSGVIPHPSSIHHQHQLSSQIVGGRCLAQNMSAMAAAAVAAASVASQHQAHHLAVTQGSQQQQQQQQAAAVAAASFGTFNSLNVINSASVSSMLNHPAEHLSSSNGGDNIAIGLNSQEASLLNFLRADNADRQRDKRPPTSRFACPFCGKCVRSKENLKLHVRKHTGERPFVCLFCGRAFGGKSDLTRHLRIHTGERPYHCESCGKCFARADYLSKHLTTHIHNAPR